jgi:hypothetical protein
MERGRKKAWMVARQLSLKHDLRAPGEVNSSFSVQTDYFVVFSACPRGWRILRDVPETMKKAFDIKGK